MPPVHVKIQIMASKNFLEDKVVEGLSCASLKYTVDVPW